MWRRTFQLVFAQIKKKVYFKYSIALDSYWSTIFVFIQWGFFTKQPSWPNTSSNCADTPLPCIVLEMYFKVCVFSREQILQYLAVALTYYIKFVPIHFLYNSLLHNWYSLRYNSQWVSKSLKLSKDIKNCCAHSLLCWEHNDAVVKKKKNNNIKALLSINMC